MKTVPSCVVMEYNLHVIVICISVQKQVPLFSMGLTPKKVCKILQPEIVFRRLPCVHIV